MARSSLNDTTHFFLAVIQLRSLDKQVESTNIGDAITVRFNLASRSSYSGDWGWVLGGVDPSLTLADANGLSAAEAEETYDERCISGFTGLGHWLVYFASKQWIVGWRISGFTGNIAIPG